MYFQLDAFYSLSKSIFEKCNRELLLQEVLYKYAGVFFVCLFVCFSSFKYTALLGIKADNVL